MSFEYDRMVGIDGSVRYGLRPAAPEKRYPDPRPALFHYLDDSPVHALLISARQKKLARKRRELGARRFKAWCRVVATGR
jgi:hypothetical protein